MALTDAQLFCNAPKADSYYFNEDLDREVPAVRCRMLRESQHTGPHRAFVFSISTPTEWSD